MASIVLPEGGGISKGFSYEDDCPFKPIDNIYRSSESQKIIDCTSHPKWRELTTNNFFLVMPNGDYRGCYFINANRGTQNGVYTYNASTGQLTVQQNTGHYNSSFGAAVGYQVFADSWPTKNNNYKLVPLKDPTDSANYYYAGNTQTFDLSSFSDYQELNSTNRIFCVSAVNGNTITGRGALGGMGASYSPLTHYNNISGIYTVYPCVVYYNSGWSAVQRFIPFVLTSDKTKW